MYPIIKKYTRALLLAIPLLYIHTPASSHQHHLSEDNAHCLYFDPIILTALARKSNLEIQQAVKIALHAIQQGKTIPETQLNIILAALDDIEPYNPTQNPQDYINTFRQKLNLIPNIQTQHTTSLHHPLIPSKTPHNTSIENTSYTLTTQNTNPQKQQETLQKQITPQQKNTNTLQIPLTEFLQLRDPNIPPHYIHTLNLYLTQYLQRQQNQYDNEYPTEEEEEQTYQQEQKIKKKIQLLLRRINIPLTPKQLNLFLDTLTLNPANKTITVAVEQQTHTQQKIFGPSFILTIEGSHEVFPHKKKTSPTPTPEKPTTLTLHDTQQKQTLTSQLTHFLQEKPHPQTQETTYHVYYRTYDKKTHQHHYYHYTNHTITPISPKTFYQQSLSPHTTLQKYNKTKLRPFPQKNTQWLKKRTLQSLKYALLGALLMYTTSLILQSDHPAKKRELWNINPFNFKTEDYISHTIKAQDLIPPNSPGLGNFRNTCFFNATLQLIMDVHPELITQTKDPRVNYYGKKILHERNKAKEKGNPGVKPYLIRKFIQAFTKATESGDMHNALNRPAESIQQQDAQEFLLLLLDGLQENKNLFFTQTVTKLSHELDEIFTSDDEDLKQKIKSFNYRKDDQPNPEEQEMYRITTYDPDNPKLPPNLPNTTPLPLSTLVKENERIEHVHMSDAELTKILTTHLKIDATQAEALSDRLELFFLRTEEEKFEKELQKENVKNALPQQHKGTPLNVTDPNFATTIKDIIARELEDDIFNATTTKQEDKKQTLCLIKASLPLLKQQSFVQHRIKQFDTPQKKAIYDKTKKDLAKDIEEYLTTLKLQANKDNVTINFENMTITKQNKTMPLFCYKPPTYNNKSYVSLMTTRKNLSFIKPNTNKLFVHLKRFTFNPLSGQHEKVNRTITEIQNITVPVRDGDDTTTKEFSLSGFIYHAGTSAIFGHYWTVSRDPITGKWWKYNDTNAKPISEEDVIKEAQDAYVLYYNIPKNS